MPAQAPGDQNQKPESDDSIDRIGRDRNLLFGVFAIQMRLIDSEAFLDAAAAWSSNPSIGLIERLTKSGAMTAADCELVDGIVSATIQRHGGDASHTFQHLDGAASLATQLSTVRTDNREELGKTLGIPVLAPNLGEVLTGDDLAAVAETPGRYRSDSEYGRGGMGRILLVHDEYLSRDVALKELLPYSSAANPSAGSESPGRVISSYAARFLKEARITAQLEHPSIVPVHEIGRRDDGTLYYTMKLVRGETLGRALKRAKTPVDRLKYLNHFRDLCQAIAYAHSRQVIHRDIKPSNVMIGEFGETVVIDWGLAKVLGQNDQEDAALAETWNQLQDQPFDHLARTTPGARVGTPQYMAPEQAEGRLHDVDQRSDVFSLGVLLYEILAGERPFSGGSAKELLDNIRQTEHVPINKVAPNVPSELGSICDRALQKNPHNRYESAKELMDDIDRFLTGAIVQAYEYSAVELARRVYQRNKAPIHTALAASILLAATGVFAAVNIVRSRNAAVAARDNEAAARQQAEAINYTNQVRLAHSYLQDHNNERAKELLWETGPELRQWEWGYLLNKAYQDLYTITGNHGFAISHDAEHLACFYRHQPVTIYDAQNGSQIRSLTPPSGDWVRQTQFNSDDSRLLIQTANGPVQIWETDNWEFLGDIRPPGAGALDASFLPDGRLLTSGDDGTVRVWNQDLQEQQPPMLADAPQIGKISCSTDGLRAAAIIGEEDQRSIQVWEIASRQSIGTVKLDEDASYVQVNSLAKQAASVSGKIVKLWDLETSEFVHRWDAFPDGVSGLAYNSTGDSLAVTGHDRILTVWNTQTRQQLLRTRSSIDVAKPRWSPDGELICTLPLPYDGYPQVWNSSNLQLVTDIGVHKLPILFYGFFPDSDRLLTSSGDRTMKVWNAQSASGQQVIKQMDQRIIDLVVSADGNRFATVDFQRAVSVVDLAQEKLLAQFVSHRDEPKTAISPDGSKVLTSLDTVTLAVLDVDTNALHSTFDEHNSMVNCVAISPNGEHFASASWDGSVYVWNPNTADALAKIQHGRVPTTLMFGSSGDRLVIGDNQGNITIYNWASGEAIQQSTEHSSEVVALQWSEDRKYLASAEKKGPLVLWSFSDDEISKRLILRGHNSEPSSIAFLGESDRLASCADNGVRIWDLTTGEQVLTLDDATEASSVIAAVPGSDGLLSAQGRMVRLWSPAPWKQISAAADMQAEFQEHRRTRLDQDAESLPAGGFDSRLVIMPSARLNESLSDLKDEISSQSDAITFAADDPKGLRIVAASDQSWLELGVAVGDLIQAIDGSETSTVPLAEAAIETLMQADGKNAFSVKMLRAGQPKQIIIQRRPTTTDTITISQSRSEAINRYKRFAESLRSLRRLQTETSPANVSKAGGIVLAGTFPEQDRELLIQSGIAPEDVVVRFIDEPVTDVKQLIADVEGLVEKLQSEQVSEFEVEVRRGQFRRVRINNVVN